ncbi:MAG: putative iron-regulated membrane protein [Gammaproteobacteria bacterium]
MCFFMAAWFASGVVLIYVPFPSLSSAERLDRAGDVDTSDLKLSPADAIRSHGGKQVIERIRLVARAGRPLYLVQDRGQKVSAIWGDDGSQAVLDLEEGVRDIAAQFSGEAVRQIDGPIEYDQWVVHQGFDTERPYMRVQMDDSAGTVLYISQSSGEVLQRTTRSQRGWNYVGAVVHWIYPTALRRHWATWDQVVWWLSLAGIVVVMLGIFLGFDHMIKALRSTPRKINAYQGWMKWHHVLGLLASVFVLTWIFSGWLSMDHGRLFSMPDPTAQQLDRFRGMSLTEASQNVSVHSISRLGSFRELEIKSIAATPVMIVRSRDKQDIYPVSSSRQAFAGGVLPKSLVQEGVKAAWPEYTIQSVEEMRLEDVYRQVRQNELPMSTIRVKLDDPAETWVHVDAASGEIASVMDRSRRLYRWLYNGLHSLDFPGLTEHRPLWDIIILSLLTLGFIFSSTGAYLGIRRLKRSFTQRTPD